MRFCFVYVIFLGDLKILKDLVTRKKLFAKDFAILEGDMGFKPLCHRIKRDTGFCENITPIRFRTTVLTDLYDQTKDMCAGKQMKWSKNGYKQAENM